MDRAVVITGIGTVCAMGLGVERLWAGLNEGRCAIGPFRSLDPTGLGVRFAGEVRDFAAKDHVPKGYRKAVKVMARCAELAVGGAMAAVADAGLTTRAASFDADTPAPTSYPAPRLGCHIGAGLIAADTSEVTSAFVTARDGGGEFSLRAWGETGMGNLQPLWLLKYLPNMLSCHVGIIHGAEGPSNTITCSEASGLLSLGESLRTIQRGAADACISGGGESKLNHIALRRLDLSGRLAHVPDDSDPSTIVRPYRADAPGSIPGEGAGILILEAEESARARRARPYARIEGFGAGQGSLSGLARGEPDEGLAVAVDSAMREAGVGPRDVSAILPLALGATAPDAAELGALRVTLGDSLSSTPLVPLTMWIGTCVAGHTGLTAALGAMMVHHRRLPAHVDSAGRRCEGGSLRPGVVLVCSGSLGGQAAAMVLRSVE